MLALIWSYGNRCTVECNKDSETIWNLLQSGTCLLSEEIKEGTSEAHRLLWWDSVRSRNAGSGGYLLGLKSYFSTDGTTLRKSQSHSNNPSPL